MKVISCMVCFFLSVVLAQAENYKGSFSSPDGNIQFSIYDTKGVLNYRVSYNNTPVIMESLTKLIGEGTYTEGRLDKATVAAFLLASESNAKAIDAIVHPAVAEDFKLSGARWMECAIIYESGFDHLVDMVVAVTAPESLRLQRVMARDGITEAKAREWMARQLPQAEVERRCDYTIINDGLHDIDIQIEQLINKLK